MKDIQRMKKYLDYWFTINGIEQITNLFKKEKHDIRFVGGCVRDALLGNKSSDIDFAINCQPNTTVRLLIENNIEILEYGKKFGTRLGHLSIHSGKSHVVTN